MFFESVGVGGVVDALEDVEEFGVVVLGGLEEVLEGEERFFQFVGQPCVSHVF